MNISKSNSNEAILSQAEGRTLSLTVHPCLIHVHILCDRPGSENEPTSSEKLAIAAEMDGTREGEEKEEEKRKKDEKWAVFADENPRGIGNTMNRG
jgi:hypothetical protein